MFARYTAHLKFNHVTGGGLQNQIVYLQSPEVKLHTLDSVLLRLSDLSSANWRLSPDLAALTEYRARVAAVMSAGEGSQERQLAIARLDQFEEISVDRTFSAMRDHIDAGSYPLSGFFDTRLFWQFALASLLLMLTVHAAQWIARASR